VAVIKGFFCNVNIVYILYTSKDLEIMKTQVTLQHHGLFSFRVMTVIGLGKFGLSKHLLLYTVTYISSFPSSSHLFSELLINLMITVEGLLVKSGSTVFSFFFPFYLFIYFSFFSSFNSAGIKHQIEIGISNTPDQPHVS